MNREITPKEIYQAVNDLLEEKEQLQQRIDKAIKYIDEYRFDLELPSRQEELLEILGGKE